MRTCGSERCSFAVLPRCRLVISTCFYGPRVKLDGLPPVASVLKIFRSPIESHSIFFFGLGRLFEFCQDLLRVSCRCSFVTCFMPIALKHGQPYFYGGSRSLSCSWKPQKNCLSGACRFFLPLISQMPNQIMERQECSRSSTSLDLKSLSNSCCFAIPLIYQNVPNGHVCAALRFSRTES